MYLAVAHQDNAGAAKWGDRCLREIDAMKSANNEERSPHDIERVEIVTIYGDPARILPALIASERAMPDNYNASLRVALMQNAAKQYREAITACDRGLAHVTGPRGRAWLLQIKADALMHEGQTVDAQRVLEEAHALCAGHRSKNIARIQRPFGV